MSYFDDVVAFHTAIGVNTPSAPQKLSAERKHLRLRLLLEEHRELHQAIIADDFVEIADGGADLIVVTLGAMAECGIAFDKVWPIIHASNMAKVGGPVRADGKVLKPDSWQAPDLSFLVS